MIVELILQATLVRSPKGPRLDQATSTPPEEILADIEKRLGILEGYRLQESYERLTGGPKFD